MRAHDHIHRKISRADVAKVLTGGFEMLGHVEGEYFQLTTNDCQRLMKVAVGLKKMFIEMGESGGYVLVKSWGSDTAITAYRLDSYSR